MDSTAPGNPTWHAWRQGRGIYRYDAELADAVAASDLPSDVGTDLLYRLPEWALYVDPAGVLGPLVAGFWVHLESDVKSHQAVLRFVWDLADGTLEILPVHLGYPSLAEAMESVMANANAKAAGAGLADDDLARLDAGGPAAFDFELIRKAVLLVLYVCTDDADIGDVDHPSARPKRAMQPRATESHWEVGYRIGTALRASRAVPAGAHGGSHAAPAAHLRRAHCLMHAPGVSHS